MTKKRSINVVSVVGLLMVTNKNAMSIFEAMMWVCFDKLTDLRTM